MPRLSDWLRERMKGRDEPYQLIAQAMAWTTVGIWMGLWLIGPGVIKPATILKLSMGAIVLAMVSIGIFIVGAVRRNKFNARIKAGRCGHCGYDLRESRERCPECGQDVPAE